jgi:hypothetical protein
MKPEHEARRRIIREWRSLPKDARQTEEQAEAFAKRVMDRVSLSGLGYRGATRPSPYPMIMRWLLPRIGKP